MAPNKRKPAGNANEIDKKLKKAARGPRKRKSTEPSKPVPKVGPQTRKVNLCNGTNSGAIRIYLDASITDGELTLDGQDLGEAIRGVLGGSDHEYHLAVKRRFLDAVLLALLEVHYSDDPSAFPTLRQLLEDRGIPMELGSYTSG